MWLRILCALALLFALAAHHSPVASPSEAAIDLSQYTLPDGTVPDLCLTGADEDGNPHPVAHLPGCDACRLNAVMGLPEPSGDLYRRAEYRRAVRLPPPERRVAMPPPLYRISSRAPPAPAFAALFAAGLRLPVV
ncbi:hypothetical protein J2S76_001001 [Ancylobacter vacuolatus]|uniref:DUF2946 domain-containing protein n=1 Tax=Ancylobacter vacuolatus TaxID=223389 RepID=A0ABU0DDV8_9HYPH|nr:hypothetical protein [Ancylobacter vacuolatus]MDQ0346584.1 hypothetical protein [Ancylobacter vacuolatus]